MGFIERGPTCDGHPRERLIEANRSRVARYGRANAMPDRAGTSGLAYAAGEPLNISSGAATRCPDQGRDPSAMMKGNVRRRVRRRRSSAVTSSLPSRSARAT